MECQVEKNVHFRHLLLFAFNRGFTAAKAAREICVVYGENAMAERTARYWFAKFKEENFDLKDAPRSGRPTELDEGQLNQLLHEDSRQTTRELAERINCSHAELKAWLDEFFQSKTKDFYREGIEKLVERWGKVVDMNGEYIID